MSGDHDKYHMSVELAGNRSHKEFLQDLDDWVRDDKREWVGLTQEEFVEISRQYTESFNSGSPDWFDVIKYTGAVEAKLREKNT